jgi:hypothetical protein
MLHAAVGLEDSWAGEKRSKKNSGTMQNCFPKLWRLRGDRPYIAHVFAVAGQLHFDIASVPS